MKDKTKIYGIVLALLVLMGFSVFSVQEKKDTVEVAVEESLSQNSTADTYTEETKEVSENSLSENSLSENSNLTQGEEETKEQDLEKIEEPYEYSDLAFSKVSDGTYVNVRKEPTTESDIVGKIYGGAVAQILSLAGENEEWYQIVSGNVEGYIKAEFFLRGEEAADVMDRFVTKYATVHATGLNIRQEASIDSVRIGHLTKDEKIKVLEEGEEWLKVQYTQQNTGYVAAEYVSVAEEFLYAKTLEEEAKEIAERRERELRQQQNVVIAEMKDIKLPSTTYTTNEELRKEIVNYALQFVGNRYISGGRSLQSGTDCSGFSCYIYADFGYAISRTPEGQFSGAGRSISIEEIQPGDIVCFSSNGGRSCTHVALYIGDGQIVHSVNSRRGVQVTSIQFEPIIGIRNVID